MSDLAIVIGGETRYYPVDDSEPGWNGSLRLTIRVGRPFDLGTHPAVLVDGDARTPGSFSAAEIYPSLEHLRYLGVFWPDS